MGGGRQILELLASEDIDGDDVDLGVTVLASLGGRHVDDLARTALDNDVTVLTQSRALHGVGGGGAGIGGLEGDIVLFILSVRRTERKKSVVLQETSRMIERKKGEREGVVVAWSSVHPS